MQSNFVKVILVWAGIVLAISGCQQNPEELSTSVLQSEIASTATAVLPTQSVPETIIPTETLTPMPTAPSTLSPTLTPAATKTVSPIPWPTLPATEAAEKVLALLRDNQNPDCLLPCWWGATPGETHWKEIEPFLLSFSIKDRSSSTGISLEFPLAEEVKIPGFDFNQVYIWDDSGVITEIEIDPINISGYDAKTMITLYGIPDEVWLKTIDESREGVLPFQLVIIYQQKGISFRYYMDATKIENTISVCFEPGFVEMNRPDLFPTSPKIYVWEPGQIKSIEEVSPIPLEVYFPLDEKTDLTPELLFEKFTNPDEQPCIETPADLWQSS